MSKNELMQELQKKLNDTRANLEYFKKEGLQKKVNQLAIEIKTMDANINKLTRSVSRSSRGSRGSLGSNDPSSVSRLIEQLDTLNKSKQTILELGADITSLDKDIIDITNQLRIKLPLLKTDLQGLTSLPDIAGMTNEQRKQIQTRSIKLNKSIGKIEAILKSIKQTQKSSKAKKSSKKSSKKVKSSKMTSKIENPNMSEYGGWADSIRRMQEKHPTVGGRPITWYQATPDGSCFFIAVEAALNRRTNVHNRRLKEADELRKGVVASMDQYKDARNDFGAAAEMFIQLNGDIPGVDLPTSINDELLRDYKKHMSKSGSYAGEIELKLVLDIINRPILIFKLDPRDKGRIKFPSSGYAGEEQNFNPALEGFPQFNGVRPIILGHIAASPEDEPNHYIYALFDDEIAGENDDLFDLSSSDRNDDLFGTNDSSGFIGGKYKKKSRKRTKRKTRRKQKTKRKRKTKRKNKNRY